MTPAFAHGSEPVCDPTLALIAPSPASGWEMRWNWSDRFQMSLPPASTVNVPPLIVCDPVGVGFPMSAQVHTLDWHAVGGGGAVGGMPPEALRTVASTSSVCEETAIPASTVPVIPIVSHEPAT